MFGTRFGGAIAGRCGTEDAACEDRRVDAGERFFGSLHSARGPRLVDGTDGVGFPKSTFYGFDLHPGPIEPGESARTGP